MSSQLSYVIPAPPGAGWAILGARVREPPAWRKYAFGAIEATGWGQLGDFAKSFGQSRSGAVVSGPSVGDGVFGGMPAMVSASAR